MSMSRPSGTEGYAEQAEMLIRQYESISFAEVHRNILRLVPPPPSRILDVGAGTGRDAAGFAALGHRVTAVEPIAELRLRAQALHTASIEWVDDSLPDLATMRLHGSFDVVMLTAVWMHLDKAQRQRAMPRVASLLRSGGMLMLSLRHGPVPPGRRMFEVTADETIGLACAANLKLVLQYDDADALSAVRA